MIGESGHGVDPMTDSVAPLKVLLVEDSELDAELVLDQLIEDSLDIELLRVETESAFVEAVAGFRPDLIIADLSMPEFSGYRALEIARTQCSMTPFIFVSGTIGDEAAVKALRDGATDYVLKHNLARLPSAVRRALAEAEERRARQLAEAELMRVQRYESVALLASGLSHDLRNVLQPIAMGAALLHENPNEEIRKVGHLIDDCTQRGLDIVASMLSFARGSRAAVHRVDVKSVVDGLVMLLRSVLARNIEIEVRVPDSSIEVDGNATELQQCFLNLCLNAGQAMPEGGTLTMEAVEVLLDASFFTAAEQGSPGRYLLVSIRDTGIGMSEDVRRRLFTPFFTTKEQGTGLGLLSCRRIVANHQGLMRMHSEPGKGTVFSVYLPLAKTIGSGTMGNAAVGRGERVLLVIERESKLVMLQDIIETHGYSVSPADNGAIALQSIERDGLPDVVVMDARMTLMTGVATASKLVEMNYLGPLILIAGKERAAIEQELPPLPSIRFIDRPVNPDQLLAVLAAETRGG